MTIGTYFIWGLKAEIKVDGQINNDHNIPAQHDGEHDEPVLCAEVVYLSRRSDDGYPRHVAASTTTHMEIKQLINLKNLRTNDLYHEQVCP